MQPKEVSQIDTFALVFETRSATLCRYTQVIPIPVDGTAPTYTIESEFIAHLTDGSSRPIKIIAPVAAASLTEAFEKAEDALRASFEEFKAKTSAPRLVVPGANAAIPNLRGEASRKQ